MKKIHVLALTLAVATIASVAAQRTMAQGQGAGRTMNGEEVLETASGNTTIGVFADRAISFAVYLSPNGDMIGRISDEDGNRIERGSWRVENDKLYGRWDNLRGGAWYAFQYRVVGDNIHAYREDGTLDRIQYYLDGDPFGLQAAAATAPALVQSDYGNTHS